MKVIYISSPYTLGGQAANVGIQMAAANRIIDLGGCPVVPLLFHFMHITRPRGYEEWMKVDLEMVGRSDAVLRLPGESAGADREVAMAKEIGIPVFTSLDDLKLFLLTSG